MTDKMLEEFLPPITEDDRQLLHYTPNTDDLVEFVKDYAMRALQAAQAVPEHIRSIKIPTDTMEQEFQHHYRRGFEAGKKSAQSVPVVGEAVENAAKSIASMVDEWVHGCIKNNGNWQESLPALIRLRLKRYWPATSITEDELKDLRMCKIAAREEARRVDELTAELERLRKDAARYYYIRDRGLREAGFAPTKALTSAQDEAIDAAIAAEGEKE